MEPSPGVSPKCIDLFQSALSNQRIPLQHSAAYLDIKPLSLNRRRKRLLQQ
jgi:hypothetical protein